MLTRILLTIVGILIALPGVLATLRLTVLSVASLFYREPHVDPVPRVRFLVLVPAHNEEEVIGDAVRSMVEASREGDTVLVVADRCTDATVEIAEQVGATVLAWEPTGKAGRAAAVNAGLAWAADKTWEAAVIVDADSIVVHGFFDACERILGTGAAIAQARSEAELGTGVLTRISEMASAMQGVSVPRGRDRLGLSVRLRGSGMVLRRSIAGEYPFRHAGASEDLWHSLDLLLDGVIARHVDSARLRSATARSVSAATPQRIRWESGRMAAAKEYVPRLLRAKNLPALEAAIHLVTPPLAVAGLLLLVGALPILLAGAIPLALVLLGCELALALNVAITLCEARASARTWLAIASAPIYIVWKAWIQLRAALSVRQASEPYERTPRD